MDSGEVVDGDESDDEGESLSIANNPRGAIAMCGILGQKVSCFRILLYPEDDRGRLGSVVWLVCVLGSGTYGFNKVSIE